MAGSTYNYDDNGAIFNYFLLSLLSLILIPTTFSGLFRSGNGASAKIKKTAGQCDCEACKQKRTKLSAKKRRNSSPIPLRFVLIVLGWCLFGFVAYQIATTHVEETGLWDPYVILGVDSTAGKKEIRDSFKKLSLKYHPDKVIESEKEEAASKFVEISKAYNVLTDEEARKTWDEFGHPDGKQASSLGIALPKWLVDRKNNSLVLLVYAGVFGVALPYWVASWWYKAKNVSGSKIQHRTMGTFYQEVKEHATSKSFLETVCKADEIMSAINYSKSESKLIEDLVTSITEKMAKLGEKFDGRKKPQTLEAALHQKALILLYSHILRLPLNNKSLEDQRDLVAERALHVVPGILQISAARFWLSSALNGIDLGQMIAQATFAPSGPLAQLPHLTPELIKTLSTRKVKPVRSIRELLQLSEAEQAEALASLDDDKRKEVLDVAAQYPILRVRKAHFFVTGESAITPSSIVTLHVKIETITPEELSSGKQIPLETSVESEEKKAQWFEKTDTVALDAHAPYYPVEKTTTWWVMLGDKSNNRLISLGKITDVGPPGSGERSARLQFQAPPKSGEWQFQVFLKCDSVIGCDGLVEAKLVVEDAPPAEIEEDNISEPDEDTIAGQMQAIRSGKVLGDQPKRERDENEDSSDSDDE